MSFPTFVAHGLIHASGEIFHPLTEGVATLTNTVAPIERITPDKVMELGIKGWLPEAAVEVFARTSGVPLNLVNGPAAVSLDGTIGQLTKAWNKVYYAMQEQPAQAELREISNRFLLTDQELQDRLRLNGYYSVENQQQVANLRYDIPGPSDLVRFSIRHLWEPDILAGLGYNAEFPGQIIDVWHRFKGLDYPLFTGPFQQQIDEIYGAPGAAAALAERYIADTGSEPTWAQAYWYSHWVLPSPTQFFQMWIKLNPDRDPKWDGPEMEGVRFTYDQMLLGLRANDYPPLFRPLLAAINRPVPGIRYARDFRSNNVYNYQDLYSWGLRQGYTPRDALDIANDIEAAVTKSQNKPAACKACREVEGLYEIGVITRSDLLDFYLSQGLTVAQSNQKAELEDLAFQGRRAREVVATVRKRFLVGELSSDQASNLLSQFGIVADRIGTYLADWQMERQGTRRQLSAASAQKLACKGLISLDQLGTRLTNLGYSDEDAQLLSQEATACQLALAARAAAAAAKQQQQTISQNKAAQKAQAAALKELQRQLAAHGTPAQLRKWFCEGHIQQGEVYRRLNFLGWPNVDIARLIGDCKQQSGSTGSGSGSGSGGNGAGG